MNLESGDEETVFELLANKHSRMILSLASIKECSASQLSQKLGIPLATVYTVINLSGNEEKYYRCAIREATIHIHDGTFSVDFKKEDHSEKIIGLWKRLAHANDELK